MKSNQLGQALQELEGLLKDGAVELRKDPAQFALVTTLCAELKRLTPGQKPSPKLASLLQSFLMQHLDSEVRSQRELLDQTEQSTAPKVVAIAEAHRATLQALTLAKDGVRSIDVNASPAHVASAGVRLKNATDVAERAVARAEAVQLFKANA